MQAQILVSASLRRMPAAAETELEATELEVGLGLGLV